MFCPLLFVQRIHMYITIHVNGTRDLCRQFLNIICDVYIIIMFNIMVVFTNQNMENKKKTHKIPIVVYTYKHTIYLIKRPVIYWSVYTLSSLFLQIFTCAYKMYMMYYWILIWLSFTVKLSVLLHKTHRRYLFF